MQIAVFSMHNEWFAQVLEAKSCKTQIVDEMFGVLRSFFADAKQSRNRECALSATVLENLVLDTPTATVRLRLVPMFTMAQLAARSEPLNQRTTSKNRNTAPSGTVPETKFAS